MDSAITVLLQRARVGDSSATEELMPLVYGELHRIAVGRLQREGPGHTLQPTALVNEVYLRLFAGNTPELADRAHFMAIASQVMRRILVDHARAKAAEKRGGEMRRVDDDNAVIALQGPDWKPVDLLTLNEALEELQAESPHLARAIELHHFGGLTAEETAAATGRSIHAVRHDLRFAHAWLRRRLAN
jgi:RNA polymerase sigma factor (TIGR02999 family)